MMTDRIITSGYISIQFSEACEFLLLLNDFSNSLSQISFEPFSTILLNLKKYSKRTKNELFDFIIFDFKKNYICLNYSNTQNI